MHLSPPPLPPKEDAAEAAGTAGLIDMLANLEATETGGAGGGTAGLLKTEIQFRIRSFAPQILQNEEPISYAAGRADDDAADAEMISPHSEQNLPD